MSKKLAFASALSLVMMGAFAIGHDAVASAAPTGEEPCEMAARDTAPLPTTTASDALQSLYIIA